MPATPLPAPAKRRTQAERSRAMRERLLSAALDSLAEDGYVASTLSAIVRRAGVSRGAQVHHYPSKQALMLDVAEDLLRRTYRQLGVVMLSIADEDNRLDALVDALRGKIFQTRTFNAYLELLISAQRDPELSDALRALWQKIDGMFDPAINHYFEPAPGVPPALLKGLFRQFTYLMTGLMAHQHIGATDEAKAQVMLWTEQTASLMRARKGVATPPPRPRNWSSGESP